MIRYIKEVKGPGDDVWAKYTEEQLKTIAFSSTYTQEIKNKATAELQRRANLQNDVISVGISNPLIKNYWWENVNLKGYPEEYPPVIYQGQIITSDDSSCTTWSTYKGQIGCYDNQIEEHKSFMKKWYKDNTPGDEFYKNNPFYIKGEDGLPVFSYDESRRTVPTGFHAEEYPIYLAEVNNIKTKFQNKKTELQKLRDSDVERLNGWKAYYEKQYRDALTTANASVEYQPGTGLKNSSVEYDYAGGIGAIMASPTSGGVATGNREMDAFVKTIGPDIQKNIENTKNQINQRLTQFATDGLKLDKELKKELEDKKNEYYHEEFPNGITKEDYAKYLKMDERTKERARYYNQKVSDYRASQMDFYQSTGGVAADATYIAPKPYTDPLTNQPGFFGRDVSTIGMPDFDTTLAPSKIEGYQDIDWEMEQIKGTMYDVLAQEGNTTTYLTELQAAQMYFGYQEPTETVEKPWESGFWEWGHIGENFMDWFGTWDIHDVMTLISIAVMVIPGLQGVGLAMRAFGITEVTALGLGLTEAAMLSAAVDLLDAGIYVSEGNNRMAGLSVLFAIIPFAIESSVVKKVFAKGSASIKEAAKFLLACPDLLTKTYTQMTMKEIYQYTKIMLKDEVQAALKYVAQNGSKLAKLMQEGVSTVVEAGKKTMNSKAVNKTVDTAINFSKKGVNNVVIPLVKAGATFGGYMGMGYSYNQAIDYGNDVAETPKSVVERIMGKGSWDTVKDDFGSDGSITDNTLLKNAILDGWRPGMPVPIQYQTETYKKRLEQQKQKNSPESIKQKIEETVITDEEKKNMEKIVTSSKAMEVFVEEKVEEKRKIVEETDIVSDEEMNEIIERVTKLGEEGKIDAEGNIIYTEPIEPAPVEKQSQNESTQFKKEIQKESKWIQFLIDCEIIK